MAHSSNMEIKNIKLMFGLELPNCSHGLQLKINEEKSYANGAVPQAPIWVPSQRSFAPTVER